MNNTPKVCMYWEEEEDIQSQSNLDMLCFKAEKTKWKKLLGTKQYEN